MPIPMGRTPFYVYNENHHFNIVYVIEIGQYVQAL